jgi:mono/diheme cytochrome c family protein
VPGAIREITPQIRNFAGQLELAPRLLDHRCRRSAPGRREVRDTGRRATTCSTWMSTRTASQREQVMRISIFTGLIASGIICLATSAMAQPALVAKGQAAFAAQKCSMCHSVAGKGNPKGPLEGVGAKYKPAELRLWLTDPAGQAAKHNATRKPAMRDFSKLPAEDLDALVAYLQSLGK